MIIPECTIHVPNNETQKDTSVIIAEVHQVETAVSIRSTSFQSSLHKNSVHPSTSSSHPPNNCPDGGQWGMINYIGPKTSIVAYAACFCCGLPGLAVLACPQDNKDAYLCQDKIYDAGGKLLVFSASRNFTPTRNTRDF
eukprot:scaffold10262_cov131-Chaetoceros_neogracile.AAC.4